MEYRLARLIVNENTHNSTVAFEDVLTADQYAKLTECLKVIEQLDSTRRLLEYVKGNNQQMIDDLQQSVVKLNDKSNTWYGVQRQDITQVIALANNRLLNYLASVRTFLDHSDTFINRKFGKHSNQFSTFKATLSSFFDGSFAYRFFYKLRNYAQHVGMPIDAIEFTIEQGEHINTWNSRLLVQFNRNQLLMSYDDWGAIVKSDLEQMSVEFPVTPLVYEMTQNLMLIYQTVEMLLKDELKPAALYVRQSVAHLLGNGELVFLADNFKSDEKGHLLSFEQKEVPINLIEDILSLYSHHEQC